MKKGILVILSGPSGVGKGTVTKKIINDPDLNLYFSISMTTREIRKGEVNGVNYIFVSAEQFEEEYKKGNLLESAIFVGNRYGTPANKVEEMRNEGKNVLLEIEINGANQVMEKVPDCVSIYLVPPSFEALEARIRGRSTESEEIIQERLSKAKCELLQKGNYKYTVLNDDVDRAAAEIKRIILENTK